MASRRRSGVERLEGRLRTLQRLRKFGSGCIGLRFDRSDHATKLRQGRVEISERALGLGRVDERRHRIRSLRHFVGKPLGVQIGELSVGSRDERFKFGANAGEIDLS